MYIRNIAGYPLRFGYNDVTFLIKYDGRIYSVPDDFANIKRTGVQIVRPAHVGNMPVIYVYKDGTYTDMAIEGNRKRGRPVGITTVVPESKSDEVIPTTIIEPLLCDLDLSDSNVVESKTKVPISKSTNKPSVRKSNSPKPKGRPPKNTKK